MWKIAGGECGLIHTQTPDVFDQPLVPVMETWWLLAPAREWYWQFCKAEDQAMFERASVSCMTGGMATHDREC
jgi:hypothetical protein